MRHERTPVCQLRPRCVRDIFAHHPNRAVGASDGRRIIAPSGYSGPKPSWVSRESVFGKRTRRGNLDDGRSRNGSIDIDECRAGIVIRTYQRERDRSATLRVYGRKTWLSLVNI